MNSPSPSLTLAEMQHTVDRWITTIGVRYFSPLTNMAILAEETGEVARIMARTHGDQSAKPGEKLDLADELAYEPVHIVGRIVGAYACEYTQAAAYLSDTLTVNIHAGFRYPLHHEFHFSPV